MTMPIQRRTFLATCAAFGALQGLSACTTAPNVSSSISSDDILDQIQAPSFPDRTFDIRDFGASTDSNELCTDAIRLAIEACNKSGGGQVLIPEGNFTTGAVHLLSNVNLHISEGATLRFSTKPADYLPAVYTHWEGIALMGYSPLIYAHKQTNIAITGKGTLDGMGDADNWWYWKGGEFIEHRPDSPHQAPARKALFEMAEKDVPVEQRVFAEDSYLRPSFIQPVHCSNILIEDVTIRNAPFWLIHPLLSDNITVRGVSCISHGPNSDGCDPESCKNVLIEDCVFDTGDDCIAIKSGRNNDGRRRNVATENVVIRNCTMRDGHGGVVIGSEISAGVRNVFVENCEMSSPNLERAIRIKTNARRGGIIENLHYKNINVGQVRDAFVINFYYEEADQGEHMPIVRNISITNLTVEQADKAFMLRGFEQAKIQNIQLKNVNFKQVKERGPIEHVVNMSLKNVELNGAPLLL